MNLIYEESGVIYHEVHVYRLLHQWGFVPKVAIKRFVNSATDKEKLCFKKKIKAQIGTKIRQGFTIMAQDESIFIADAIVRKKMWVKKGTRPTVFINGTHQKTIVFGALTHDGKQLFRQYDKFDQYCFLDFLKALHEKFGKIIVCLDRAAQHYKSKIVKEHVEETDDVILVWFPKGSSQFNAIEECWKQGKYDLWYLSTGPSLSNLKKSITNYYSTKRFKLDILKYMQRNDCV